MDEGKIAFTVGEALSYLDEDVQYAVLAECEVNDCIPSYAQAVEMKKLFQNGELTNEAIENIMNREKPNQREKVVFQFEKLQKYFPKNTSIQDMQNHIVDLLERELRRRREDLSR